VSGAARRLGRLFAAESRKALHHRLLRGTAAVTVLASLAAAALVLLFADAAAGTSTTGFLLVARAARTAATLAAVTALLLGCQTIAREASEGTLVLTLVRPVRRTEVVVAKAAVTALAAIVVFAVAVLAAAALAAGARGFGPIESEGYVILEAGEIARTLARALALTLPALIATAAFGILVSSVATSGTAAVTIGLLSFVPLELARRLFESNDATAFVFSTYTSVFVTYAEERARGFAVGLDPTTEWLGLAVPVGSAALFAAVAALITSRREVRF